MVRPDPGVTAVRQLSIARLEYAGNWNPEPGGWKRLHAILWNQRQIDLTATTVPIKPNALTGFGIAHLTGTGDLKLNDAARAELLAFVQHGGTLIVDAAGGDAEFATSAEAELRAIFQQAPAPLKADHPVVAKLAAAETSLYRPFARHVWQENPKTPRLRGIEINNRTAVFFSAEDLSAGLVRQDVDGIVGYTPEVATELMMRMIEYAGGK